MPFTCIISTFKDNVQIWTLAFSCQNHDIIFSNSTVVFNSRYKKALDGKEETSRGFACIRKYNVKGIFDDAKGISEAMSEELNTASDTAYSPYQQL